MPKQPRAQLAQEHPCQKRAAPYPAVPPLRPGQQDQQQPPLAPLAPTDQVQAAPSPSQHALKREPVSPSPAPQAQPALRAAPAAAALRVGVPEEGRRGWTDLGQGAYVGYFPGVCQHLSAMYFHKLLEGTDWQERTLRIMGKEVLQPRLVAYYAEDPSLAYTYSGTTLEPLPWSEDLVTIRQLAEGVAEAPFNSVLLNYYRGGNDHVSWHADDEKLYGANPTIASVSFGATRDFLLRCNADPGRKVRYALADGDLLVMKGAVQALWQHCVPKRARLEQPRINLTFRTVRRPQGKRGRQAQAQGQLAQAQQQQDGRAKQQRERAG